MLVNWFQKFVIQRILLAIISYGKILLLIIDARLKVGQRSASEATLPFTFVVGFPRV